MKRWLVVVSEVSLIRHVEPFTSFKAAKRWADEIAVKLDPQGDDVVVWDLALDQNQIIYSPLHGRTTAIHWSERQVPPR